MQGKHWCLTLNNYDDDDLRMWAEAVEKTPRLSYLCFQEEKAPSTGTPHLQGYASFLSNQRLTGIKKVFGHAVHGVRANGSPSANRAYCKKKETAIAETFKEFGIRPDDPLPGKRTDLEIFKEAVENGLSSKKIARQLYPEVVAKYPRYCYDIIADASSIHVEEKPLYEWQEELNNILKLPPDDRTVIFIVDVKGGQGKTWFAKKFVNDNDDSQYLEPAKKVDMAYALNPNIRVLFLNVTRTTDSKNQEYLYSFIESVKDGMVMSSKYESGMKYLGKVHVVVMMNTFPNMALLSDDRYKIIELK